MSGKLSDIPPWERGIPCADWERTQQTVDAMYYRSLRLKYARRDADKAREASEAHERKVAGRKRI